MTGKDFRFYDSRQKYLLFVTTTNEKNKIAESIQPIISSLKPKQPALKIFDAGLGDGSLPLDKFQYYLKQDYIFLFYYCKVLALASSKSNTENIMSKWVSLLDETLNSEMNLHRNFCKEYGISEIELENTEKDSSTEKYCNFLLKNAEENSIEFIAVSLLPCQWGYQ